MDLMLILFFISLLIICTGLLFKKMEDVFLTEPLLAMAFGIFLGPDLLKVIGSESQEIEMSILKTACEFTIAMALMATALRLPRNFYIKNAATQSTLVIMGMLLMWLSSAAIFYWLLEFSIPQCLLLGAIVTPTDPVVASTIVTGKKAVKYLPQYVRNSLSFEAGANDGLAYPIVLLSIFLVDALEFPFSKWLTQTLFYETILCGVLAFFIGLLAGKLMHKAHKTGFMNQKSLLSFSLALSFLLLAGFDLLQMNGILAVFVGGLGYARVISKNEDLQEEKVQESIERIFTIPVYFIFGLMLPWEDWFSLGWTAVSIVVLILLFRRLPSFFIMMPFLPKLRGKVYDIFILGWFGPIGVAALYYAILSQERSLLDEAWIIPSLIVFASTILHGVSSVPLERKYASLKRSGNTDNTNQKGERISEIR